MTLVADKPSLRMRCLVSPTHRRGAPAFAVGRVVANARCTGTVVSRTINGWAPDSAARPVIGRIALQGMRTYLLTIRYEMLF